ncbi:3-oxoacyl-ACP reductase FabG [Hyphomicrobium sp.]|uniref:3-oxoacyl-ACP reductase FabG n=1 Tax=Hyphomicrobium sp. TaxID=82 RepID=UPI0025BD9FB7|nr:3-oxoacyl-ACP reductase FabG [Hyphomicrobium sp.]MCC7251795.1 3-oxoacyl-ACP reductase FabG [Hyphomicrobium sp.]
MLSSIAGRSVIVTGGSKGIGKGIAKVFARNGAKVLVVSRNLSEAEATAEELKRDGGTASGIAADVTQMGDLQVMAEAAHSRHGGIDILCANAGIFPQGTIEELSPEDWDHVLGTNLKGTFLSLKACLPYLKASDQGRVVVTSSITGPVTGFPGWTHYGASKAGQLGFLRTACLELAKHKITVNAVLPGNILTEGLIAMGDEYLQSMAASIPLKKLGTVEDIGYAALFLASKEAAYITGQTIIVDGGQILPESLDALK